MVGCIANAKASRNFTLDEWIELDRKRRTTIPELSEYQDNWMEDLGDDPADTTNLIKEEVLENGF